MFRFRRKPSVSPGPRRTGNFQPLRRCNCGLCPGTNPIPGNRAALSDRRQDRHSGDTLQIVPERRISSNAVNCVCVRHVDSRRSVSLAGQRALILLRRRDLPCLVRYCLSLYIHLQNIQPRQSHHCAFRPSVIVGCGEPAGRLIGSDERDGGDRHHEVSILIASCLMVGRWRCTQPAASSANGSKAPPAPQWRSTSGPAPRLAGREGRRPTATCRRAAR
jgi:hypothetical protein